MGTAFLGIADGIDVQGNAVETQRAPQPLQHDDLLGVDVGTFETQRFDIELVKLAVTALLRTLVAEYRPCGPHALRTIVREIVLDRGAHDAGGCFRTQRQALTIEPIFERVHFLFDDVGDLADRAHEQRSGFDQGHLHVTIAVLTGDVAYGRVEVLPQWRRVGQQIVHAAHGLNHAGHDLTQRPSAQATSGPA